MRRAVLAFIMMMAVCMANPLCADQVRKITNFSIEKVQTTSNNSGQISLDNEGWLSFTTKSKKELDKAAIYFGKLDQDKQAIVYASGETIIGVNSPKFGTFGVPPATGSSKAFVGLLNGCSIHQGSMNCGINLNGKDYYLDDTSTNTRLMEKLYAKSAIGKKVKIVGILDGETINATQIKFVK